MSLFYFTNLFNLWLSRRQVDSHICFCIQFTVFFCWSIWRKSGLRDVAGKGRSILIVFSDSFGHSSLILHQNATSGRFLKVSWNIKPETISVIFCILWNSSTLVYFVPWMNLLPIHILIIICLGHLETVSSLSYIPLPDVDIPCFPEK